ncbi:MAG TPA: type 2 lanthipeptide synthetase LanM, partial [Thermoanaerobaculia bacterium]
ELLDHLQGWAETEVRVILRTSQTYALLLEESYHPDLLRDALDRDRHFDRLWYGLESSHFADLAIRVIPHEVEDLWRGDIPLFTAQAGSRDLWTAGGRRLPGALARSGLEMVRLRLERFGEDDLGEQLWYVKGSLTALAIQTGHTIPGYGEPSREIAPGGAGDQQLLAVAERVADRLARLAKRRDGECAWIGLNETMQAGWSLHPLEMDLYSGLPGIALFLAYLDAVLEIDSHRSLVEGTLASLRRLKERRSRSPFLGSFNGWSGLLYAWLHVGFLWGREDLVAEAMSILPLIEARIAEDRALDLTRGCAGGIVTLLGVNRATGSAHALELARRMGDRLVETARPFGAGLGWLTVSSPYRPLTGVSHGASGFAWALGELYGATGDARFREVAAGALAFEAALYSPKAMNWPDLRMPLAADGEEEPPPRYMAAWCHGACGIGLTRLQLLRHLDDPAIADDARNALETTLRYGFGSNHCLCHGDLGSLELLLEASRRLGEPRWAKELHSKTSSTLASIEEFGFLCGIPLRVETPGLMDGLAGIGYGMLRLAAPDRVPSVLSLEPPACAAPAAR